MNERNFLFSHANIFLILAFCSVGIVAKTSSALPNYAKTVPLLNLQSFAIANDINLKGTQIFADDKDDLLYISPSAKKSHAGKYKSVRSSSCEALKAQYEITYRMPDVSVNDYVHVAEAGPFSPFFDAKIGNYIRHASILNRMASASAEIALLKNNHKELVAEFEHNTTLLNNALAEMATAEAAYALLSKNIESLSKLIAHASDIEERERVLHALAEARVTKKREESRRAETVLKAQNEVSPLLHQYAHAKTKYEKALPTISDLENQVASLDALFESINQLSVNQFNVNERALQAFENTAVGSVTASYSIWGDEEERLKSLVPKFKNHDGIFAKHDVSRLPIYNIRLKKPTSVLVQASVKGAHKGRTDLKIGAQATDSGVNLSDDIILADNWIFTKDGHAVIPKISTLSDDGARKYNHVVTRGTYCTGTTKRVKDVVSVQIKTGASTMISEFDVHKYKKRTKNVLAQSVALDYEYYVRNDPTGVSCTLDVTKFILFAIKGSSSKFLFWRTAWNDEQVKQLNQSGIECSVALTSPREAPGYIEQTKRNEAIRQAMIREIAAEFILNYAKRWTVTQAQPALPKKNNVMVKGGAALEALCGAMAYCTVDAGVIKNAEELFGTHADRIRNRNYLWGRIRRAYDEASWTVSYGSATIDLLVKL